MKYIHRIILNCSIITGCKSQSEVGLYIFESWLPHHSMCFVTRIDIRAGSTFEYIYQGDLFNDHEMSRYQRKENRLYFLYNKKPLTIFGYDTAYSL